MPPVSSPGLGAPPDRGHDGRSPTRRRPRPGPLPSRHHAAADDPGPARVGAARRRPPRRRPARAAGVAERCSARSRSWSCVGLVWHGFIYWLASNTVVLGFIRLLLCALAVGWALLFIDAWRLGQPLELLQKQRLAIVGLNGVLCFAVAGVAAVRLAHGGGAEGLHQRDVRRRYGDRGPRRPLQRAAARRRLRQADRWGLRPDSITVASIDADTGKTILFGLPRNMTNFPFAEGSVMAEQFPDSYDCDGCELNSLATWAADHKSLFKGYAQPRCRGHQGGRRGDHRAEDQLLRDGQPAGLPQHGAGTRRAQAQRPRPDPDRRRRRPGHRSHRARGPAAQRLPDAVVRPVPRERRRLLADGPAEVRDERDAAAAVAHARSSTQVRGDRQGEREAGHHRPARLGARHASPSSR